MVITLTRKTEPRRQKFPTGQQEFAHGGAPAADSGLHGTQRRAGDLGHLLVGEPLDVAEDDGEPLEERAVRQELARCLEGGLASLPADQRLAVILRDVQGLAYEEVAEATGASLGTVKSRISRGRAVLRDFLLAQGELLPSRFRHSSEG